MTLSADAIRILDFEEAWGVAHSGRKEEAIHNDLKLHPARYYQLLNRLARDPEAIARNPQTLRRVRDLVDDASARRSHLLAQTPQP